MKQTSRKVWVNLYRVVKWGSIVAGNTVYDTKEDVERQKMENFGEYMGAFPIEIEE